jgi:uncharacterized protein
MAYAASFDCITARSSVEKAVCINFELGKMDEKLMLSYKALARHLSSKGNEKLRVNEANWISSLEADCNEMVYNKISKDLSACLINKYEMRLEILNKLSIPIEGNYRYIVTTNYPKAEYELLDGRTKLATFINQDVISFVKSNKTDKQIEVYSNITQLSSKVIAIEKHADYNSGAYPDFSNVYSYIDPISVRKLTYLNFFKKEKLSNLSEAIFQAHRREGSENESSIDCYKLTRKKDFKKLIRDISAINITPTGIMLRTSAPHVCGPAQLIEINIEIIKPYITEKYMDFIK